MIRLVNLWKRFGRKEVLRGVSLTIEDGETLAILGKSGTGKTVTLKHILGLLYPDRGEVYVDGLRVDRAGRKELYALRRRFGYVFQGAALFDSMTVYENVALPLVEQKRYRDEEIRARVRQALEMVDLAGTEALYPSELSGGMRKRVGIARAIVHAPEFLLYDEPTAGLDPVTADRINDLMLNLKENLDVTGVMVTHDLRSALRVADRLVLLDEGEVVVDTPVDRILEVTHPAFRQFLEASGIMHGR